MATALAAFVALLAAMALFDLAAVALGHESRDGFADDRLR